MATKDEALKMAIEAMCDFDYDKRLEAIKACKEALKPHPDCDEACMFQCQMEKEHGMTYEQGFDHGWEARLAEEQPAQEPVAWMQTFINQKINEQAKIKHAFSEIRIGLNDVPLYTHPHQWQELTGDEITRLYVTLKNGSDHKDFARAIEQALKEKNHV